MNKLYLNFEKRFGSKKKFGALGTKLYLMRTLSWCACCCCAKNILSQFVSHHVDI